MKECEGNTPEYLALVVKIHNVVHEYRYGSPTQDRKETNRIKLFRFLCKLEEFIPGRKKPFDQHVAIMHDMLEIMKHGDIYVEQQK